MGCLCCCCPKGSIDPADQNQIHPRDAPARKGQKQVVEPEEKSIGVSRKKKIQDNGEQKEEYPRDHKESKGIEEEGAMTIEHLNRVEDLNESTRKNVRFDNLVSNTSPVVSNTSPGNSPSTRKPIIKGSPKSEKKSG